MQPITMADVVRRLYKLPASTDAAPTTLYTPQPKAQFKPAEFSAAYPDREPRSSQIPKQP